MIPYLLAAVGGYLIGQSQKKDVPKMAKGGSMNKGYVREDEYAKGGLTDIKLYYHKTSGGAEYLLSSQVKKLKQKNLLEQSPRFSDAEYIVRIDGAKKQGGELYIKDEVGRKQTRLYYHKTSGGAEYLMSSSVKGTNEGSFDSKFIVRIDGAKTHGGELMINLEAER